MSFFSPPGTLVAVVKRDPPRDEFGDPTGPAPTHTIEGCELAPGDTTENQDRADTVVATWTLYTPDGADITATDTVSVPARGIVDALVEGQPKRWRGAGVVVALRQVRG